MLSAMTASLKRNVKKEKAMKTLSLKMLISLVGIAFAVPFFAVAVVVGARVVNLAQNTTESWLFFCVGCGAAAMSVVNGLGRRTAGASELSDVRSALNDHSSVHQAGAFHVG